MKAMLSGAIDSIQLRRFIFTILCGSVPILAYAAFWNFSHGNTQNSFIIILAMLVVINVISVIIFIKEKLHLPIEEV